MGTIESIGVKFNFRKKKVVKFVQVVLVTYERERLIFFQLSQTKDVFIFFFHIVLPSAPRNAHTTFVNQSALGLQWQPPQVTGDQTQVWYDVYCRKPCDIDDDSNCVDKACGNDVVYEPSQVKLSIAQVIVGNLSSFINYTIKIYARNRVSEVAESKHGDDGKFETITVRTNGSGE